MNIKIKKSGYLIFNKLKIKCCVGKSGIKINKTEGDKATPRGVYTFGKLYYRHDRIGNIKTKFKKKRIMRNTGWCHDSSDKNYNKEVKFLNTKNSEKLFRTDHKYDVLIVINYNSKPVIPRKGSAIFFHLTKNYKKTKGCVAVKHKDFLLLLKYINKKTKIIIG